MADLTPHELHVLTATLLGEAGGEGRAGMTAVMYTILNRSNSGKYPSNPALVAIQKMAGVHQYSTWNKVNPAAGYSSSSSTYKMAQQIVQQVINGEVPDPTGGGLYYYANSGPNAIDEPGWFSKVSATNGAVQIGNQIFQQGGKIDVTGKVPLPIPRPDPGTVAPSLDGYAVPPTLAHDGGGGLVTHHVHTVPIDPLTGNPIPQETTAASSQTWAEYKATLPFRGSIIPADTSTPEQRDWASVSGYRDIQDLIYNPPGQQTPDRPVSEHPITEVRHADGTTSRSTGAGYSAMPGDYAPHILTPTEPASYWTSYLGPQAAPKTTAVTVTSEKVNPEYTAYQQKLSLQDDIFQTNDMTPALNSDGSVTTLGAQAAAAKAAAIAALGAAPDQHIKVSRTVSVQAPRPAPPPVVQIGTGKVVPVGTQFTAQGGKYTYEVQADGSILNKTTGRISGAAPSRAQPTSLSQFQEASAIWGSGGRGGSGTTGFANPKPVGYVPPPARVSRK